ncbi:MAG: heavy-metal-associated domain-containing protein [Proteobacteria bacterium]|nr:heavy-metal-associated domain-containing protein [Pseudomonadota bacterium]
MTKTYRVLGMTCDGCAKAVTNAIKTATPEAAVEVDLDAKQVTVEGAGDDSAIQQAIESAGFEYGGPA